MSTATVPIFAPDGSLGDVPYERMHDAIAAGGKIGVNVKAPNNGGIGVLPYDRIGDAVRAGAEVIPYHIADAPKPGALSAIWNDIKGFLTPSAQNPYPGMGQEEKASAAAQSAAETAQRKQEGYSLPYRVAAPFVESAGVNVPGMEQSAREGDVGGVVGHALSAPLAAGVTAGAVRGAQAIGVPFGEYIGMKSRASEAFSRIGLQIGDAPVAHQPVIQALQRVFDLDKKGFTAPTVATKFRDWIADRQQTHLVNGPNGELIDTPGEMNPLTFNDARDFYTAINEAIDWDREAGGKGGRLHSAMMKVRDALDSSLRDTAKDNQMAGQYDSAMRDYAKSVQLEQSLRPIGSLVGRVVGYQTPVHPLAGGYIGARVGQGLAGSMVRSVLEAEPSPPPRSFTNPDAVTALMLAAKNGEISPGEADRRIKLLGGQTRTTRMPQPPP